MDNEHYKFIESIDSDNDYNYSSSESENDKEKEIEKEILRKKLNKDIKSYRRSRSKKISFNVNDAPSYDRDPLSIFQECMSEYRTVNNPDIISLINFLDSINIYNNIIYKNIKFLEEYEKDDKNEVLLQHLSKYVLKEIRSNIRNEILIGHMYNILVCYQQYFNYLNIKDEVSRRKNQYKGRTGIKTNMASNSSRSKDKMLKNIYKLIEYKNVYNEELEDYKKQVYTLRFLITNETDTVKINDICDNINSILNDIEELEKLISDIDKKIRMLL